jgi:anti-sigma B factor antagonist
MAFMNCPRCGLAVRLRAPYLTLDRCPRCLAKSGLSVPMTISEAPIRRRSAVKGEDGVVPGGLSILATREPDVLVLELRGELALASAPVLNQRLRQEEALGLAGRVVIDLSGVEFLDSAGLHALLNAQRRLRQCGSGLFLRRGPRAVQRVFQITGAITSFWFED